MTRSAKIRELILQSLEDMNWHNIETLLDKCKENGIDLEKGRGPIYTAAYILRKQGMIESDEVGNYRRLEKKEEEH